MTPVIIPACVGGARQLLGLKIRVGEKRLLAEFPDGYPRYRQQVP